ncbi:MAG: DUF488 domain-containing protein [Alphaproteobacteria bacterium]|nr:DUF488 domain-containing protein [Alphaproteobacteria bacterium]
MTVIKTIGHSNHAIERFVALLAAGGVETVVDVRSTPYSRRFPQFGRERLAGSLAAAGLLYRWEGAALGGKPRDGAGYEALAERPEFKQAVDRLVAGAGESTLCLMCAEKEPLDCHRTVLVSRRLAERGVAVEHLLADGGRKAHAALEDELLAASDRGAPDLFTTAQDRAERLAEAWRGRERAMRRG